MLVLGLEFSGMSRRKDLRLGFNSLGAYVVTSAPW